jgi:hypothetical protein
MHLYHAKLTVKTCHNPPGLGVLIEANAGGVILNETLVKSRVQPVRWNGINVFDLIVNISHNQSPVDSIVVKVSLGSVFLSQWWS